MSLVSSSSDDEEFQSPTGATPFVPNPEEPSSSIVAQTPRALRQAKRAETRTGQLALEEVKRGERRQRRLQDSQQPAAEVAVEPGLLEILDEPDEADETLQVQEPQEEENPLGGDQELEELSEESSDDLHSMDGDGAAAAAAAAAAAQPGAAQAQLPGGSGLPFNQLENFFGKMDEDFNEWRDQYDLYAITHGWDEATKLRCLPMCLKKNAQDAYRNLDDATKADWTQLCAALERRFHPASVARFKRVELMHRQQRPGEAVLDYATVIQHLSRGACMGDNEDARKEWMREFFLHGLTQRLRESVLNAEPDSFEQAVSLAQRHEANLHLIQGTTPSTGGIFAGFQTSGYGSNPEWNYVQNKSANQNWNRGNRNYRGNGNGNRQNGGWERNRGQYTGFSDRNVGTTPRNRWTNDGRPICDICRGIGHVQMSCPGNQGGRGQWMPRGSGQRSTPYGERGQGTSGQGRLVEPMQRQGNGQWTRGNGQWSQGNGQWNRGQWNQGNANQGNGSQGASQGSGQYGQGTRGTYRRNRNGNRRGRINAVEVLNEAQDGNPNEEMDQDSMEVALRGRIVEGEHQIQTLQEQVNQLQMARYPDFVGMIGNQGAASGSAATMKKAVVPMECSKGTMPKEDGKGIVPMNGSKGFMPKEGNKELEQFIKVMAELKQKRKCAEPVEEHPVMAKRGVPEQGVKEPRMGMVHAYSQRKAVQNQWRHGIPEEDMGLEQPIVEEPRAQAEMQQMMLLNGGKVLKKLPTSILRYVPPPMVMIQPFEEQGLVAHEGSARTRGREMRPKELKEPVFDPNSVKLEPKVKVKLEPEVKVKLESEVKAEVTDDKPEMSLILADEIECEPMEVVVQVKPRQKKVGPPVPPKPMKTFRGASNFALKQAAMLCRPRGVATQCKGATDTELLLQPEKLQEGATLQSEFEEDDLWKGGGMTEEEMDRYITEQEQGAPGTKVGYLKKYRVAQTAPRRRGRPRKVVQTELKEHECLCEDPKPRQGQSMRRMRKKPDLDLEVKEPEVEVVNESETEDDWGMKQLEEILLDLDARLGRKDPMLPMIPEEEKDVDTVRPEDEVELPIAVPPEALYDDLRRPEDKEVLHLQVGRHQAVELALPMMKTVSEKVPEEVLVGKEVIIGGRKVIYVGNEREAKKDGGQRQLNRWRHPSIGGITVEQPKRTEAHQKSVTWKLPAEEEKKLQTDMCQAIRQEESEQVWKKRRTTLCCPKPRRKSYSSAYLAPSSYLSSTCMMLLAACLFCLIQPCSYAYKNGNPLVCQTHQSKTIWKLPDTIDCKVKRPRPKETPVKATVRLYKRNHIQYKSEAWVCKKVTQVVQTLTYFFADENLKKEWSIDEPIDGQECNRMKQWKTCSAGQMTTKGDLWRTTNDLNWKYPGGGINCCHWKEFRATNCFMYAGYVYKRHSSKEQGEAPMESTAGVVSHCDYKTGACALKDGTYLLWEINPAEKCEFLGWKTMTGRLLGTSWIADDSTLALTMTTDETAESCQKSEKRLQISDQGIAFRLYVVGKNRIKRRVSGRKARFKKAIEEPGIVTTDQLAASLQAVSQDFHDTIQFSFAHALASTCNSMQMIVEVIKASILANPEIAIRHLLDQYAIFARAGGNALEVFPCQELPDRSFQFLKMNETCTREVPIKFQLDGKGHIGYMDPVTNIIHRAGYPTDCALAEEVPLHVSQPLLYSRQTGLVRPINYKMNVLRIYDWNASMTWIHKPTIFHQIVMYQWDEFQSHVTLNDLMSGLGHQEQVLKELGMRSTQNPTRAAEEATSGIIQKGLFGFLSGLTISWKDLWIFAVCLYVTITGIISHCVPSGHVTQLNVPERALQIWQWMKGWRARRERDRRRRQERRRTDSEAEENLMPVIERRPSLPPRPSPSAMRRYLLSRYATTTPSAPRAVEAPPERQAPLAITWPLDYRNHGQRGTERINMVEPQEFLQTINIPGDLVFIPVKVQGIETLALMDCGSSITFADEELARQAQENGATIGAPLATATSVTGHNVPVVATGIMKISMGTVTKNHTFHVVANSPHPCIIGMDLLRKFEQITLDLQSGTLRLGKGRKKIALEKPQGPWAVCNLEAVKVPPRTQVIIPCYLQAARPVREHLLFEPDHANMERYGLFGARALTPIPGEQRIIPIQLLNPSYTFSYLYPNTTLGRAESMKCIVNVITQTDVKGQAQGNMGLRQSSMSKDKLLKQIDLSESALTAEQKGKLMDLLYKHSAVFAADNLDLGRTSVVQHRIDTGDAPPIKQRAYPIPQAQKALVKEHIDHMLEMGVIEPSVSPWASPIVIVKKHDGTDRFCVDFRKVNAVTKRDVYPLPVINEILELLGNATLFTSLDLMSGFWQVEIQPQDQEKTAFITCHGLYQFKIMCFGLCNAPATFQRLMDLVLSGLNWNSCLVYIDDILVFSRTFEDHLEDLEAVFLRLLQYGLKLKPKKCTFAKDSVPFLGHIISAEGIKPDPEKIKVIENYPPLASALDVQRFMGLTTYYRKFVEHFASIARPLTQLTHKDVDFQWGPEQQKAFEELKKHLITAPILVYPDFSHLFILFTDASMAGLGAVLSQQDDRERDQVIAYASRQTTKAERNYSVIELEACAVVWGVTKFRCYIFGRHFKIVTDHAPLKWLMSVKNPSGRLQRWALQLQEYDFFVETWAGKANRNADVLSRIPEVNFADSAWFHDANLLAIDLPWTVQALIATVDLTATRNVAEYQKEDVTLASVIEQLEKKKSSMNPRPTHNHREGQYTLMDDKLYWVSTRDTTQNPRLVVPIVLRGEVLLACHDDLSGGHFGITKTFKKVAERYYWDGMVKDVENWCTQCLACATKKDPPKAIRAPLYPIQVVNPFDMLGVDVMGPVRQTYDGNRFIVVFMDYFTKWPEAFATADQKADTIANLLVNQIISRHGTPRTLLSDRGSNFLSTLVREVCKLSNIHKVFTTPYHPQTDGLVERYNYTLATTLSMYMSTHQRDWDAALPLALFAYRTATQESTGNSPFEMLYGRKARLPIDAALDYTPSPYQEEPTYTEQLAARLTTAWESARNALEKAHEKQKEHYDNKATYPQYGPGDLVMVHNPHVAQGLSKKFTHLWHGPYEVFRHNFPNVELGIPGKPQTQPMNVHINRTKLYKHSEQQQTEPTVEHTVDEQEAPSPEDMESEPENEDELPLAHWRPHMDESSQQDEDDLPLAHWLSSTNRQSTEQTKTGPIIQTKEPKTVESLTPLHDSQLHDPIHPHVPITKQYNLRPRRPNSKSLFLTLILVMVYLCPVIAMSSDGGTLGSEIGRSAYSNSSSCLVSAVGRRRDPESINSSERAVRHPHQMGPSAVKVLDTFRPQLLAMGYPQLSYQICHMINEPNHTAPLFTHVSQEVGPAFLLDHVRTALQTQLEGGLATKNGLRLRTTGGTLIELIKRDMPKRLWKKITKTHTPYPKAYVRNLHQRRTTLAGGTRHSSSGQEGHVSNRRIPLHLTNCTSGRRSPLPKPSNRGQLQERPLGHIRNESRNRERNGTYRSDGHSSGGRSGVPHYSGRGRPLRREDPEEWRKQSGRSPRKHDQKNFLPRERMQQMSHLESRHQSGQLGQKKTSEPLRRIRLIPLSGRINVQENHERVQHPQEILHGNAPVQLSTSPSMTGHGLPVMTMANPPRTITDLKHHLVAIQDWIMSTTRYLEQGKIEPVPDPEEKRNVRQERMATEANYPLPSGRGRLDQRWEDQGGFGRQFASPHRPGPARCIPHTGGIGRGTTRNLGQWPQRPEIMKSRWPSTTQRGWKTSLHPAEDWTSPLHREPIKNNFKLGQPKNRFRWQPGSKGGFNAPTGVTPVRDNHIRCYKNQERAAETVDSPQPLNMERGRLILRGKKNPIWLPNAYSEQEVAQEEAAAATSVARELAVGTVHEGSEPQLASVGTTPQIQAEQPVALDETMDINEPQGIDNHTNETNDEEVEVLRQELQANIQRERTSVHLGTGIELEMTEAEILGEVSEEPGPEEPSPRNPAPQREDSTTSSSTLSATTVLMAPIRKTLRSLARHGLLNEEKTLRRLRKMTLQKGRPKSQKEPKEPPTESSE